MKFGDVNNGVEHVLQWNTPVFCDFSTVRLEMTLFFRFEQYLTFELLGYHPVAIPTSGPLIWDYIIPHMLLRCLLRLTFRECFVYHSNCCPQLSYPLEVTCLGILSRHPHLIWHTPEKVESTSNPSTFNPSTSNPNPRCVNPNSNPNCSSQCPNRLLDSGHE